ncbi:hypothetical protein PRIPAC_85598 [Pristionchus pacificus]|uniref:PHD finger motif containing protein n=1 Tax=Pristionchus pacificus TaxID=54126 RepID=A0A2A6BU68_PRIPA|nr:hypothetical protein PRIPAC_85598 [Pristionchus pacificus]|eukprot:PDM69407.1 PHD finger motif containing protein [Pristionchus pacificus]
MPITQAMIAQELNQIAMAWCLKESSEEDKHFEHSETDSENEGVAWEVKCLCGTTHNDGEPMIACDQCIVRWEHIDCMFPKTRRAPKGKYFCHTCKPRKTMWTPQEMREYQEALREAKWREKEKEAKREEARRQEKIRIAMEEEARKKEKFAEVLTAVEDLLAVLVLPTRRKVEVKEAMRESSTESDAGSEKSEVSLNQTESDAHSEKSEMVVDSTDPESESSIDVQSMKRTLEETNDYAVLDARRRNKRRRL